MNLYDKYHKDRRLEKRVISDHDFTHTPLLKVLNFKNNRYKKILDVGCGTGTVCFYFASKGLNTLGIDISKKAIKLAKLNAKNLKLLEKTKFLRLDFPNDEIKGKFDLVICSEVLEHIRDQGKALNVIFTLLKKGGQVVFSVPLKSSSLYKFKFLQKFEKDVGHLRRYDDVEFVKLVRKTGLKILKVNKNQGLLRDYLFTSTRRSLLVALANRFKIVSDILTFLDKKTFFFGVSNMVLLAKRA